MGALDEKGLGSTTGNDAAKGQTIKVEWEICEDDSRWHSAQEVTSPLHPAVQGWGWRLWAFALILLFCLLISGVWLWHQANEGLAKIEGELQQAAEADQWQAKQDDVFGAQQGGTQDIAISPSAGGGQLPVAVGVQLLALGKEWALVWVTTDQGSLSMRQTRLYRKGVNGWYEAPPTTAEWGASQTLETGHFTFHYYAHDALAVAAAAVKLDALYPTVAAPYPLNPAVDSKRDVWVSPAYSLAGAIHRRAGEVAMEVASPGLYLVPSEFSEGDILAQAVLLKLLYALAEESVQHQVLDMEQGRQGEIRIRALLESLQLWQLWSTELPLAPWNKLMAQWTYGDSQRSRRMIAPFDVRLCPVNRLWQATPYALQIPLLCGNTKEMAHYEVGRYFPDPSPRSLADIHIFIPVTPNEPYSGIAEPETVELATVYDYASTSYGRERIAILIANATSSSSWETLIPAAFGVPLAEFEAGWNAYLREHYGVDK